MTDIKEEGGGNASLLIAGKGVSTGKGGKIKSRSSNKIPDLQKSAESESLQEDSMMDMGFSTLSTVNRGGEKGKAASDNHTMAGSRKTLIAETMQEIHVKHGILGGKILPQSQNSLGKKFRPTQKALEKV